jgi:hypothetical protein
MLQSSRDTRTTCNNCHIAQQHAGYHKDSNAVSPKVFGIQKEGIQTSQKSSGNANEAVTEEKNVKQKPCTERDLKAFIFQAVTKYHMGRC